MRDRKRETEIIKKARAKESNKKRKKITFLVESERDSERERWREINLLKMIITMEKTQMFFQSEKNN